jgi:SAM-dependent methyltransferase
MDGKKLSDYTWIYPIKDHKLWHQRWIYLGDVRNTYCPNCECRFEFPEGIEKIKYGGCPECKTVFFHNPYDGFWYFLPDDFEFDLDKCPDCGKEECPEKPDLDEFFYCIDCGIEFNWSISPLENGLVCIKFPYKEGKSLMNKQQMNDKYKKPDPFGVLTSKADGERKAHILKALNDWITEKRGGEQFERALDIGCGEGFITKDIPAKEIVGFDVSDLALSRCPEGIITVDNIANIEGEFDCILAAGVMVREYDFVALLGLIDAKATEFVLTCQTDLTEVAEVTRLKGNPVHTESFPYNVHKQNLRVFDYRTVEAEMPPVGATSDSPDGSGAVSEPTGDSGHPDPEGQNVTSGEGGGRDKTFKEIVDEKILELPEDHDYVAIMLTDDTADQLFGHGARQSDYEGFKVEIDNNSTGFSFTRKDPGDPAGKDYVAPEPASEGETVESFPDAPDGDSVSQPVDEPGGIESPSTGDEKPNF